MNLASTESNDSSSNSNPLSTGLLKLKPISALLRDDSNSNYSHFAHGENSISDPFCEISQQPSSYSSAVVENAKELPVPVPCPDLNDVLILSDTEDDPVPDEKPDIKTEIKREVNFVTPAITPSKVKRKFKKLTGNYHKLTDFFTAATTPQKANQLMGVRPGKENVSANSKEGSKDEDVIPIKTVISQQPVPSSSTRIAEEVPQFKDSKSSQPVTKFDVRRKLCMGTDLRKVSNRHHAEDQTRLGEYYEEKGGDGGSYFRTHEASHFPVTISGDFDVEEVMELLREDGKDGLDIEMVVDGNKSILIDLKQVQREGSQPQEEKEEQRERELDLLRGIRTTLQQLSQSSVVEQRLPSGGTVSIKTNKESVDDAIGDDIKMMDEDVISIGSSVSDPEDTQYVPERVTDIKEKKKVMVKKATTGTRGRRAANKSKPTTSNGIGKGEGSPKKGPRGRSKVVCPSYKIIRDTKFAVDAFRFGSIDTVTHYFLTHFHSDHYVGLKRSFVHPIYMSLVTANLVRRIIKVEEQFIHPMELDTPVLVDGVEVTALDANQ